MGEIPFLGIAVEIWALFLSVIAIIFTLLKDFILPLWFKPKLVFHYEEKPPFRREEITINNEPNHKGTFLRFSVRNEGRMPAINCRCQLLGVEKEGKVYGDYQGYPLKWASRPESVINQITGERLNVGIGETEFIDIAVACNIDTHIHLEKYHRVGIGIKEIIEAGKYELFIIFSGDNFKPHILRFGIEKEADKNPKGIKLKLLEVTRRLQNG